MASFDFAEKFNDLMMSLLTRVQSKIHKSAKDSSKGKSSKKSIPLKKMQQFSFFRLGVIANKVCMKDI